MEPMNTQRAAELPTRKELHLARKLFHFLSVMAMAVVYALAPLWISMTLLFILIAIAVPLDFLRLRSPGLNAFILSLGRHLMRKTEINSLAGTSFLFLGVSLSVYLFSPRIVFTCLLFLAIADPLASLVGTLAGRIRLNFPGARGKSLEGFLASTLVCSGLLLLLSSPGFFEWSHLAQSQWIQPYTHSLGFIVVGGLAGGVAELIQFDGVDDNFSMPILSGLLLTALEMHFLVY